MKLEQGMVQGKDVQGIPGLKRFLQDVTLSAESFQNSIKELEDQIDLTRKGALHLRQEEVHINESYFHARFEEISSIKADMKYIEEAIICLKDIFSSQIVEGNFVVDIPQILSLHELIDLELINFKAKLKLPFTPSGFPKA